MSGTIESRILERSVIRHIPSSLPGTEIGEDFMVVSLSETGIGREPSDKDKNKEQVLISAQGYNDTMPAAEIALVRALNNLATAGVYPGSISVDIMAAADLPEEVIREEMLKLTSICKKRNIRIMGGNTVRSSFWGQGCIFLISAYAYMDRIIYDRLTDKRKVKPGDKVVISGCAGDFGCRLLVEKNYDKLLERFAPSYLNDILGKASKQRDYSPYEITGIGKAMIEAGAIYLHDVTYGGIYRTLYEVSQRSGLGIRIIHEKVPIRQETIEICEYCNINPYQLNGMGGLVSVIPGYKLEEFQKYMEDRKINYSVAGQLTQVKERLVVSDRNDMKRSLIMYSGDEMNRVKFKEER
ncbi:MAG: hypothetical protein K6E10_01105 [Eubacterium sp.]|nr:hypothetical protein [Eubacterium sp.]